MVWSSQRNWFDRDGRYIINDIDKIAARIIQMRISDFIRISFRGMENSQVVNLDFYIIKAVPDNETAFKSKFRQIAFRMFHL